MFCMRSVAAIAFAIISMSTYLTAADVHISVIKEEDYQRILDFLRLHYYPEEPLTIGTEPKQQDKRDEENTMESIEEETCLMAVDKENDTVVGVVLARPKNSDEAEELEEAADVMPLLGAAKWSIALKFLARVEREADVYRRYGVQNVLHVHALAVDAKVRSGDIGYRLLNELKTLGKQMKYELLTADCTSYYSAKMCEHLGWDCVNSVCYKDYVDENQKEIIRSESPNYCCKTYATRLRVQK